LYDDAADACFGLLSLAVTPGTGTLPAAALPPLCFTAHTAGGARADRTAYVTPRGGDASKRRRDLLHPLQCAACHTTVGVLNAGAASGDPPFVFTEVLVDDDAVDGSGRDNGGGDDDDADATDSDDGSLGAAP